MIEDAIYTQITSDVAVAAVLSTRLYPVIAPDGASLPYATYQVISDLLPYGVSGSVNLRDCRVQVSVWATTYDAARSLAKLIETAVDGAAGTIASMDVDHMETISMNDLAYVAGDNEQQDRFGKAIDVRIFYRE